MELRKLILLIIGILFILWFFNTGYPFVDIIRILYESFKQTLLVIYTGLSS